MSESKISKIINYQCDLMMHILGSEEYAVEYTRRDPKETRSELRIKNLYVDGILEKLKIVVYYDSHQQFVSVPVYIGYNGTES